MPNQSPTETVTIPDTPDALIESSSEATLTLLCEDYDALSARDQRLVRLVQAELMKGALTDDAFARMLMTIVFTWQQLTNNALTMAQHRVDTEPEIDTDWIHAIAHFSRMDQYQCDLARAIADNPGVPSRPDGTGGRYSLHGPGDR